MSKSRYPKERQKGECRGCGAPVPKGRLTWCSAACFAMFDWPSIRQKVWNRDGGKCQSCGTPLKSPHRYCAKWECDHILPVADGGTNALDNLRALCVACHKRVTAAFAAERAKKRRNQSEGEK